MTTFAQWRTTPTRTEPDGLYCAPRKYDVRVVDQFYTYCSAVSHADRHRAAAAKSQRVTKHHLRTILIAGTVLGYYLVERVAQAMSLF